ARPAWTPPLGPAGKTVVIFCIIYVAITNLTVYLNVKLRDLNPELAKKILPIVPDPFGQFGAVTGLEQGWGVFAPEPARGVGWFVVVGYGHGKQIEIFGSWKKPPFLANTYANGRWRRMYTHLAAPASYPYLAVGLARYYLQEWNRGHGPTEQLQAVEV